MSVAQVLGAGRRRAELLMLDTGTITRAGAEPVWDPDTGAYQPPARTQIYSGRCRVKPQERPIDVQAGEQEVAVRRYDVALPHGAPAAITFGDVLRMDTSSDTALIGRDLVVVAVETATARTARWLIVEDRRG